MSSKRLTAFCATLLLTACAADPSKPDAVRPVETVTVERPVPVPCLKASDIPARPVPTSIDTNAAGTEQLAAAAIADLRRYDLYAKEADAVMRKCAQP
jgi:hypothetical protein